MKGTEEGKSSPNHRPRVGHGPGLLFVIVLHLFTATLSLRGVGLRAVKFQRSSFALFCYKPFS
jgi:hypothetical protein